MVLKRFGLISLCLALVLLFGCGKGKRQKQVEEAEKEAEEFAEEIGKLMESQRDLGGEREAKKSGDWFDRFKAKISGKPAGAAEAVEGTGKPADVGNLEALFPETLAGMRRTDVSGERTAVMGMDLSHAEATYAGGGGEIRIEITDMGDAAGSPMMAGAHAWAKVDIDREGPSGYEKTTTFSGYRAFESYDNDDKSGNLAVLVGGRFVVEAQGSDVGMDVIKDTLGKIDLGKLEQMK